MTDKFTRMSCIPGMLIFGTGTVTLQKFIFQTRVEIDGEIRKFKKPWFQTEAMFMGMFLCLVVYEITRLTRSLKKKSQTTEQLLEKEDDSIQHWKHYFYVAVPALCDLCATCLMNIGLFYLDPSVWQMLRGSMVIFSTLLSLAFLKKKYYCYHWTGVSLVTVGLVIVACSTFMIKEDEPTDAPTTEAPTTGAPAALFDMLGAGKDAKAGNIIIAILLVIGAQIIQASQIVIEEFLLKNVKAAASLIVGLEGLWGGLVGVLVMIGVHNTPTTNPLVKEMFHEDSVETWNMIKKSDPLKWLVVFYVLFILFYNLFGMMVTQVFSAVYRTIMEAIRTICIWIVNVIIFYIYVWADIPNVDKQGEGLDAHSIVELIGFCILLTGNFIFNRVLRFTCFYYEDQTPVVIKTDKKETV